MSAALAKPAPLPIGVIKTFGPWGPMYEVIGSAPRGPKGEMVRIKVFFTEEEADYPYSDMLADPVKA